MNSPWMTVVWERSNSQKKWVPYSGQVCQLLEQSLKKNLTSVCLGDADSELKPYIVNLKDFIQVSEETGTKCQVRRSLYNADSAVAQQVAWQWKGDGHGSWNYYCAEVTDFIEAAYKNGQTSVDLSERFHGYPYVIDFRSMMQKNKKTRRHRHVSRVTVAAYPVSKIDAVNGSEPSFDVEKDSCCDEDMPEHPQANADSHKAAKVPLLKKVTNFWNQLTRSSDSDAESGSDACSTSISKKQKSSDKSDRANKKLKDYDAQYALVDGKPWKHAWPPSTPESQLKPVPGIAPLPEEGQEETHKGRRKKGAVPVPTCPVDVIGEFTEECSSDQICGDSEDPVCIICYEPLSKGSSYDDDSTVIKLKICSHMFHKSCIKAMFESGAKDNFIQCPTCKTIHGVKHGNQPPGKMTYHVLPYSLPGHPDCDTIRIIYNIPQGIQGPEHPNPGKHYSARGFPRHCYLPDNEMGRKILRLLIKAWERKLIFTIGASSTTGEQNTVTWNEIHHKTEFGYNNRGHGYPDPNYFENVKAELEAQGVTDSTYAWYPALPLD